MYESQHAKQGLFKLGHFNPSTNPFWMEAPKHSVKFPDSALETTVEAYPTLHKAKLKTELSLVYENEEFKSCSGADRKSVV